MCVCVRRDEIYLVLNLVVWAGRSPVRAGRYYTKLSQPTTQEYYSPILVRYGYSVVYWKKANRPATSKRLLNPIGKSQRFNTISL